MARYGLKMTINQLLFFGSLPNLHGASGYIWGHNFRPNQDLEPISTSKWPDHQNLSFVKDKHTYGKQIARKGSTKVTYKETFVSKQSCLYMIRVFKDLVSRVEQFSGSEIVGFKNKISSVPLSIKKWTFCWQNIDKQA